MSNFEERFNCREEIKEETKAIDTLEAWRLVKSDAVRHLSESLDQLKQANRVATDIIEQDSYNELSRNLVNLCNSIRAMRPPRYLIDAVNDELERNRDARLRRARKQFSNSETFASRSRSRHETKAWGKLSSVASALTEDNSTAARSTGQVAGEQVHSASAKKFAPRLYNRSCPVCNEFYRSYTVGAECIYCGNTLPVE